MAEQEKKLNPLQIMQLAQMLKKNKGGGEQAQALEQLAQTGLNEEQQAQLQDVMRDKDKMQQMLSSPQAQALMKMFGAKKQDPGE